MTSALSDKVGHPERLGSGEEDAASGQEEPGTRGSICAGASAREEPAAKRSLERAGASARHAVLPGDGPPGRLLHRPLSCGFALPDRTTFIPTQMSSQT